MGKAAQHVNAQGTGDTVNGAVAQGKFTFLSGEACPACGQIDSAGCGNAVGDRTGVSRSHSRCRTSMVIAYRLETSPDRSREASPHRRTEHLKEDKPQ